MKTSHYKRLPGRGWTWGGPSRVWLGEDHVLLVLNRVFLESYRRFFFNDIQAVLMRRTQTGKVFNIIWSLSALFFAVIALQLDEVAAIILWCIAAPFAVALLINIVLGP